jgi:protoheme IX farnesyltransferase
MLPSVASLHTTARRILAYTVALWALTLVAAPVAGLGGLYVVAALVLGGMFTAMAMALTRDPEPVLALRLFSWSITYVTLLFGAMAADRLLAGG